MKHGNVGSDRFYSEGHRLYRGGGGGGVSTIYLVLVVDKHGLCLYYDNWEVFLTIPFNETTEIKLFFSKNIAVSIFCVITSSLGH